MIFQYTSLTDWNLKHNLANMSFDTLFILELTEISPKQYLGRICLQQNLSHAHTLHLFVVMLGF